MLIFHPPLYPLPSREGNKYISSPLERRGGRRGGLFILMNSLLYVTTLIICHSRKPRTSRDMLRASGILLKPSRPPLKLRGGEGGVVSKKDSGQAGMTNCIGLISFCIILVCFFMFLLSSCDSRKSSVTGIPGPAGEPPSAKRSPDVVPEESVAPASTAKEPTGAAPEEASKPNPPVITKARLKPERIDNVDSLKVIAEGSGGSGGEVTFKYEWIKNGEPAGDDSTLAGFKRGDRISVRVTPYEGGTSGPSRTLTMVIANVPPRITEHKDLVSTGEVFSYQVKATDPDGDTLGYALKSAPKGMTIDPVTGLIKWSVPEDFTGKADVTVSVTDGHGGETFQSFAVDVGPGPKR